MAILDWTSEHLALSLFLMFLFLLVITFIGIFVSYVIKRYIDKRPNKYENSKGLKRKIIEFFIYFPDSKTDYMYRELTYLTSGNCVLICREGKYDRYEYTLEELDSFIENFTSDK